MKVREAVARKGARRRGRRRKRHLHLQSIKRMVTKTLPVFTDESVCGTTTSAAVRRAMCMLNTEAEHRNFAMTIYIYIYTEANPTAKGLESFYCGFPEAFSPSSVIFFVFYISIPA